MAYTPMFRTLTAREIECRVAQISKKKTGLSLLLYKDARCDMSILDESVGPMKWQRRHGRENANCVVSIWDDATSMWVEKEDTGTESNTEAEKGLASDSFKRACVNWGIGRELYTAPFIWVESANCEIVDDNGRLKCFDRFEVAEIGYNDHREINHLKIINAKTHNVVYTYDAKGAKDKNDRTPMEVRCKRCGNIIMGRTLKDGSIMDAPEIIAKSKLAYGGSYCFDCSAALKASKASKEG